MKGKTMKTLNINDPKYYDPFLETLRENTKINNHNENCSLIVENFGFSDEKIYMRDITKIVEKKSNSRTKKRNRKLWLGTWYLFCF